MSKKLFYIVALLPSLLFVSCQEEVVDRGPVWPPNAYYRYVLSEIRADQPIDINLDGVANANLMKEINWFTSNCAVFFEKTDHAPILDIIWPEVRINNILLWTELPATYSDDLVFDYYPVQISYYFNLNKERTEIIPNIKVVQDYREHYTFVYPRVLNIDKKQNIISFRTEQSFLLKEGLTKVAFTATFKPGSPGDIFK
jgi:hypothetical protein